MPAAAMTSEAYARRRSQLEEYFDRTAVEAWARLTSDAPVGSIRATVRAGRDAMRATLLGMLPADLTGARVLDAGCGTGALSVEAARRGADVVAIDLSPTLVGLARERAPADLGSGKITFRVGDMLAPELGEFDHVVSMDSLIHYKAADVVAALSGLCARAKVSVAFTYAPRTPLLATLHTVGLLFPRRDRAPAIEPVGPAALARRIDRAPALSGWKRGETQRISRGFYKSQAQALVRA